jgi:hypothetical protein
MDIRCLPYALGIFLDLQEFLRPWVLLIVKNKVDIMCKVTLKEQGIAKISLGVEPREHPPKEHSFGEHPKHTCLMSTHLGITLRVPT